MLTWLRHAARAILFDEAAGQRWTAALLFLLGQILESGGVLPGTAVVIPFLSGPGLAGYGPLLKMAGMYLGAGGMLPKFGPPT